MTEKSPTATTATGEWYIECPHCHKSYNVSSPNARIEQCDECYGTEAEAISTQVPRPLSPNGASEQQPDLPIDSFLHFTTLRTPEINACSFDILDAGGKIGRLEGDYAQDFFKRQASISRLHCIVGHDGVGWYIENKSEGSITILNGRPVKLHARSNIGMKGAEALLRLGDIRFRIEVKEKS